MKCYSPDISESPGYSGSMKLESPGYFGHMKHKSPVYLQISGTFRAYEAQITCIIANIRAYKAQIICVSVNICCL